MHGWSFAVEDDKLYLTINGMKAKDINTLEEFGPIEYMDLGRTADELWVSLFLISGTLKFGRLW
jgi:hypothetical protein